MNTKSRVELSRGPMADRGNGKLFMEYHEDKSGGVKLTRHRCAHRVHPVCFAFCNERSCNLHVSAGYGDWRRPYLHARWVKRCSIFSFSVKPTNVHNASNIESTASVNRIKHVSRRVVVNRSRFRLKGSNKNLYRNSFDTSTRSGQTEHRNGRKKCDHVFRLPFWNSICIAVAACSCSVYQIFFGCDNRNRIRLVNI